MLQQSTLTSRVRPGLFIAIFLTLLSIYLATYSGRIESSDSLRVVDATSSLVNFGDTMQDESLWQDPPRTIYLERQYAFTLYPTAESLIVYLAAIPYAIAQWIPELGQIHATWLLNAFIIALSGAVFYVLAIHLGFSAKVAISGALVFGVGTIAWVYSKTLFRDPLIILFFLLIALALERWRQRRTQIGWMLLAIFGAVAAYFTKNSSLLAIPALFIWLLPDVTLTESQQRLMRRTLDATLAIALILFTLVTIYQPAFDLIASVPALVLSFDNTIARQALHSYIFSIGGSIWGTSPVLLLALIGSIRLIRHNCRRLVWTVIALLASYAIGHALLTDIHWFGGLSFPPRFLVPTLPFVMLLTLPVFDLAWQRRSIWLTGSVLIWVALSVLIQAIFAVSLMDAYVSLLPAAANGLVEWLPGLNQPQYLRWIRYPQSWASLGWDIAWMRINTPWVAAAWFGIGGVGIVVICLDKFRRIALVGMVAAMWLLGHLGFSQLYRQDALYWATTPELFDMLQVLEDDSQPAQPLFLAGSADVTYERFILNYNTTSAVRPVVIGFQPGAKTSPSNTPRIISDFNPDRLSVTMLRFIDHVAQSGDRFWWLAHNSASTPWAIRPEERYFTQNYYLLRDIQTSNPTVRLLEFSSIRAPERDIFRLPDYRSTVRFGDDIALAGYTLPRGTQLRAGEVVPITFYWQTERPLSTNYTVSWFLVHPDEPFTVYQGIDSMPDAGFTPTTSWQVNQIVPDNRGLVLPPQAPAGDYEIWVRLYRSDSPGGSDQLPVRDGNTYDATTAILPITIHVDGTN